MFILRRITPKLVETNTYLGLDYALVLKKQSSDEFLDVTKQWKVEDTETVYGLITFDDGESIMPLYNNSTYYIMTTEGKTFSNVSEKK
jgi:hypothetical protein